MKSKLLPATHVERLDNLEKLESEGFTGVDVSLEISLFEYGLCWRELAGGGYLFVYQLPRVSEDGKPLYDRCEFREDEMTWENFDWANRSSVEKFVGGAAPEKTPGFIHDLLSYYGVAEIFGESYWEGFSIDGDYHWL